MRQIRLAILASVLTIAYSGAYAQAGDQPDGFGGLRGTGYDFGRGYQQGSLGGGWSLDGLGGYRGTGVNFGRGWSAGGPGELRGTGGRVGRGWTPDALGGWRGTGGNFGRRCDSDGGGIRCY